MNVDRVILEAQIYHAALRALPAVSNYFLQPVDPSLMNTDQLRFSLEDDANGNAAVSIMNRQATLNMSNWITACLARKLVRYRAKEVPALLITGPSGWGKSNSLYSDVCVRRQVATNRVMYIADCGGLGFGGNASLRLLQALLLAFYRDTSIVEEIRRIPIIDSSAQQSAINKLLLDSIPAYCDAHQFQMYFYFDQHSAIEIEQRTVFPFSIIQQLICDPSWERGLVIIGASANNERHPRRSSAWMKYQFVEPYTAQEYHAFRVQFQFPPLPPPVIGGAVIPDDALGATVAHMTNCIPIELVKLHSIASNTANAALNPWQKVNVYERTRKRELQWQQDSFQSRFLEQHYRAIVLMHLNAPFLPTWHVVLNQQLQFEVEVNNAGVVQDGDYTLIKPATPLAAEILFSHTLTLNDVFYQTCKDIFTDAARWPNQVRGKAVEVYLYEQIVSSHQVDMRYRRTSKTAGNAANPAIGHRANAVSIQRIQITGINVVRFYGYLPDDSLYTVGRGAADLVSLLIPRQSNYPACEFLLYIPAQNLLIAYQVTVANLNTKFGQYNYWINHLRADWIRYINVPGLNVHYVIITATSAVGGATRPPWLGDAFYVTIGDLLHDTVTTPSLFPLLAHLPAAMQIEQFVN